MSKEQHDALVCPGCGMLVTFGDYHLPHCLNPKQNKIIAELQERKK